MFTNHNCMDIKRILLTGDDGYKSIGTRILVYFLKNKFDLAIAATRSQMSGVGGHLSLRKGGGKWGEDKVDGIPVFWVDGYPCDAMECAVGYYPQNFDLVISGINLGMNIGGAIISSGTYSAATRALNLKLAKRAIAISWQCPPSFWQHKHNGDENLDEYLEYPGKAAEQVIGLAIKHSFWGAELLNINLPSLPSRTVRFTRGLPDLKRFFTYPVPLDRQTHKFTYPTAGLKDDTKGELQYDTGAMLAGYISISPHKSHNLNEGVYQKLKDREIKL